MLGISKPMSGSKQLLMVSYSAYSAYSWIYQHCPMVGRSIHLVAAQDKPF